MTLGDFLSQMGIGPKHLTERFSHGDYGGGGGHDPHVIYAYEQSHSPHAPIAASKHHHGGGGGLKSNAAMSALTLLSFLFFLHILQQCLKEHMMSMTTAPVMIMTAGREGEELIPKTALKKIDKAGTKEGDSEIDFEKNKHMHSDDNNDLLRINTAEHIPTLGSPKYTKVFKNYGNRSLEYRGFVNAMDRDFN